MRTILFAVLVFTYVGIRAQSNFIGSGISLEFDGNADNYCDLGDNYNSLNFPVTFESWVYQTAYSLFTPVFATDSYTSGNYYGLYIRFDPAGKLIFEIGSGTGAGGSHRRGKITSSTAPLNEWIHIAIIATSITDIKFYFNGVLQPSVNTDGTSGVTSMVHNSNPVNLGRYATVHRADGFIGQIDESRLWNISKTEIEIRQNMCKKLTGMELGLIGYWKSDESYTSTTLDDYSVTNADGVEIGTVNKLTSGAPIGDASVLIYTTDYTAVTLTLNSPGGDKLKVNKIVNTPHGVQVYRVNEDPYSETGLNVHTNYYYGVFTADNAVAAKYNISYSYSFSNGVVNVVNEPDASIFKRADGSISAWSNLSALLNTTTDVLTKKNINTRNEYIFNIVAPNESKQSATIGLENEIYQLKIYPNPVADKLIIENINPLLPLMITDVNGKVVMEIINESEDLAVDIDISALESGIYFICQQGNHQIRSGKFVVQK